MEVRATTGAGPLRRRLWMVEDGAGQGAATFASEELAERWADWAEDPGDEWCPVCGGEWEQCECRVR